MPAARRGLSATTSTAFQGIELEGGLWGVFRVGRDNADEINVQQVFLQGNQITVNGRVWKKLDSPTFAKTVTLKNFERPASG